MHLNWVLVTSKMLDVASKMLDVASKMLDVASKMLDVASKMLALRQGFRHILILRFKCRTAYSQNHENQH